MGCRSRRAGDTIGIREGGVAIPRSTKRTIRNTPTPLARDLLRFSNTADRLSRRAKTLAAKVVDVEKDAEALRACLTVAHEQLGYNEQEEQEED